MASRTTKKRTRVSGKTSAKKKVATKDSSPTHALADLKLDQEITFNNALSANTYDESKAVEQPQPPTQPPPPKPARGQSKTKPTTTTTSDASTTTVVTDDTAQLDLSFSTLIMGQSGAGKSAFTAATQVVETIVLSGDDEDGKWEPLDQPPFWKQTLRTNETSVRNFLHNPLEASESAATPDAWSWYRIYDIDTVIDSGIYNGAAMLGEPTQGRIPKDGFVPARWNKHASLAFFRSSAAVKGSNITAFKSHQIERTSRAPEFWFSLVNILGSEDMNGIFTSHINIVVPGSTPRTKVRALGCLWKGKVSSISSSPPLILCTGIHLNRFSYQIFDREIKKNGRFTAQHEQFVQFDVASPEAELAIYADGWHDGTNIVISGTVSIFCTRETQLPYGTRTERSRVIW